MLFIFYSCHSSNTDYRNTLNFLASKTCEAISLKNERFALADKIRFMQDTLLSVKGNKKALILKDKLNVLLKHKSKILQQSLVLADIIRVKLDSLNTLYNKAEMNSFNISIDSLLSKKGCKI